MKGVPLHLQVHAHIERAVSTNNLERLEAVERAALRRLNDAMTIGWPALAASWEADLQRVRRHIAVLKGQK